MRATAFLALGFMSAACGTALDYVHIAEPPHPPAGRSADSVEVFMAGRPSRPFVEVGIIESQQESMSLDDEQDVIAKMREFAGERGCDALAIFAGNDANLAWGSSGTTYTETRKGYRGSCLIYTGRPLPDATAGAAKTSCIPNSTQLCYGSGGCQGGQRCTADGKAYTLCDCGSTSTAR